MAADRLKPLKSLQRSWMELARWLRAPNEKQDAPEGRGEALRNQELCVGESGLSGPLLWDDSQSYRVFGPALYLGRISGCLSGLIYRIPLELFWKSLYLKMPVKPVRLMIQSLGFWPFGDPCGKRRASQRYTQYVRDTHWSHRTNWVQTEKES